MSKILHDTGWGVHIRLRDTHYWVVASRANLQVKTLCKFATAMFFDVYGAGPDAERCAECVAALAAAPKVNK